MGHAPWGTGTEEVGDLQAAPWSKLGECSQELFVAKPCLLTRPRRSAPLVAGVLLACLAAFCEAGVSLGTAALPAPFGVSLLGHAPVF